MICRREARQLDDIPRPHNQSLGVENCYLGRFRAGLARAELHVAGITKRNAQRYNYRRWDFCPPGY